MAKRKTTTEASQDGPTFEEAMEGLEAIVEAMENEQLPLEELVAYYEKGSKLMARCESILDSARERIELITLGHADASGLANSAALGDAASDHSPSAEPDDSDDDIRLF